MGKNESTYDPELRKTESGRRLYRQWKRIRQLPHCDLFDSFSAFHDWATHNGFENNQSLIRVDKKKPYSPENCKYITRQTHEKTPTVPDEVFINNWNKTVNRIRKHYGMPPVEVAGGNDHGRESQDQ